MLEAVAERPPLAEQFLFTVLKKKKERYHLRAIQRWSLWYAYFLFVELQWPHVQLPIEGHCEKMKQSHLRTCNHYHDICHQYIDQPMMQSNT
jgi:hypothetical protein